MKRKNLIISVICVLSLVAFSLTIILSSSSKLKSDNSKESGISFNENKYTDDKLINLSDEILKGKFTSIKEKSTKTTETLSPDGKKYGVTIPYIVYNFEVSANLKGQENKNVEIVFVDSAAESIFSQGEECVVFLQKNPNNTYTLVSYSQGCLVFPENSKLYSEEGKDSSGKDKVYSKKDKSFVLDYNELKDKAQKQKNKE